MTDLHIPDSQLTPRQRTYRALDAIVRERQALDDQERTLLGELAECDESDSAAVAEVVNKARWNG